MPEENATKTRGVKPIYVLAKLTKEYERAVANREKAVKRGHRREVLVAKVDAARLALEKFDAESVPDTAALDAEVERTREALDAALEQRGF